jgi:hypothetical protein
MRSLPTALHQLVPDLAQVADDRSELAQMQAEIERLRLVIRRFQRAQFGRRSERIAGDQLDLGLEDLDADIARMQARHPSAGRMSVRRLHHIGKGAAVPLQGSQGNASSRGQGIAAYSTKRHLGGT